MKKAKSKKKAKAKSKKKAAKKKTQGTRKSQAVRKAQGSRKKQGAKKTQATKTVPGGKKPGAYPPIVLCNSGTVDHNDGAITFVNNFASPCTITSCTVPCWPYPPPNPGPVVPANSQLTVALRCLPATGTYTYTASCCPAVALPPTIIVV